VRINGCVAALLELGAGFHGDLTGTENVRINAALLGLTRQQVNQRFDSIVEFSGLGDFMDEPLRTYSSGMAMRLAFSVAVNVDPDILIIDEMLGVGDQKFVEKCFERIMEFRLAGKTLLCVSHGLASLEILCDRALWLNHGRVAQAGTVKEVLQAYREMSPSLVGANSAV
jgi:ABC-type polysaccharide/polyol phosphate transport system ATPase subunit